MITDIRAALMEPQFSGLSYGRMLEVVKEITRARCLFQ